MDGSVTGKAISYTEPGKIAERVYISISSPEKEPWALEVTLWPASKASQADRFCAQVNGENFLALNDRGWKVYPNLNFAGAMGKKFFWPVTTCEAPLYLNYFFSGERPYGKKRYQEELLPLIAQWQHNGILPQGEPDRIENAQGRSLHGKRGNKNVIFVNPEFMVYRRWSRNTVIELEEQGALEAHIIDALGIPLATWEETL